MYYYPFNYPSVQPMPPFPTYMAAYPIPRSYPPVDTKIFAGSVKSFRLLMEQGSILLDRLGDASFAKKMMGAAQQGKNTEVDQMIKSIGLKVPVITKFTPTGVNFILTTQTTQQNPLNCCSLTIAMKWGQ
ncbi:hypothetical protein BABA_17347 [Neobacillus bataviensis LMG 21833]|uniref:Inner spore coat protein n=1 Tax=Neobacillus bataviensis LMG 21833 TaxID=1117379 RepID=K6DZ81_9BACI|nr:hypothetical protein [Neobacillus bataviensis]EKN66196.1 hypothetical protein BABA_17347 [Neobacillus bataviensis LMG 21833]